MLNNCSRNGLGSRLDSGSDRKRNQAQRQKVTQKFSTCNEEGELMLHLSYETAA